MRDKVLSTENFLLALQNGVAEIIANLGKDTSNFPVVPLFDRDGGFGVEKMGGGDNQDATKEKRHASQYPRYDGNAPQ